MVHVIQRKTSLINSKPYECRTTLDIGEYATKYSTQGEKRDPRHLSRVVEFNIYDFKSQMLMFSIWIVDVFWCMYSTIRCGDSYAYRDLSLRPKPF